MKKIVAIGLAALFVVSLSACGDEEQIREANEAYEQRKQDRYVICVEAGGSYYFHANDHSYECIIGEVHDNAEDH